MDVEYIRDIMEQLDIREEYQWTIGGVGGGNCWNDGGHYSLDAETEPDDYHVPLIENLVPDIKLMQYHNMMKDVRHPIIEYSDRTAYEYYGNYDEIRTRTLNVENLAYHLTNMGF